MKFEKTKRIGRGAYREKEITVPPVIRDRRPVTEIRRARSRPIFCGRKPGSAGVRRHIRAATGTGRELVAAHAIKPLPGAFHL